MGDNNGNMYWDQRVAPQDNGSSGSQVILSGIPTSLTHANVLGALKMASGLENITVFIKNDNTAIVNGLSTDAHRFFISQGVVMVAGHWLKVIRAPSGPSGSSNFYQSTTTSTDQQGRTNSSVPRNDDGKVSHGDPHTVQEYPPYPSSTQGDGGYDYSQSTQGDGGYDYPPSTQGDGGYDSPQSTQGDGGYDRSIRVSSGFSSATPTGTPPLPPSSPSPPSPSPPPPPYNRNEQHSESEETHLSHRNLPSLLLHAAIADVKHKCPVCHVLLLSNDINFINSHINNCLDLDNTATTKIAPSSPSASNRRDHETSGIRNGNNMVGNAPYRHKPSVVKMEAIETTSRPRNDENSTFSAVFGEVLCCEIGRQTRIGSLKFASHEDAGNALAAEGVLFPSDNGGSSYEIDNKKAMIFGEAVPKVFVENIPHELLQQPENALIRAIEGMQIFQGVITNVDLRNRERMAIVWLTDTEARCRVLGQCQSFAPVLNGCAVFISTMRAMPAIWEFDDEWYQHNQFPRTIGLYDKEDSVFLRNWKPEIWKKWKSKYAIELTKAVRMSLGTDKDDKTISRVNQQMHGIRVAVMLSTLSAVHNGYYCPAERDPTLRINIPRPSQPSEPFTFAPLPPASTDDFAYTSVSVIKEDCLLAALSMKERGFRPVVLNMASATNPGGGYRKGDGAQEENIFRRSNYFLSLDDPANPRCPTYPIAEFGGIYTPDITIFRDSEDSGYSFRQKPFTVDFIAVAAYRKPKLQNNCLSSEDAAKTRRKIEAIFAIALHKGHDCLLLSALGCGAFQNPPDHVAAIFLAVAQQYSRKFREIVFAVVEDHNSVTTANPAGNYEIFSSHLNRTALGPGTLTLPPLSAPPASTCSFGGRCEKSDATHSKEFYHPPFCPYRRDCKLTDAHHLFLFRHVMSADHILKLKNPKWASHEARHHPLVKKICEENKCSEIEQTQLEDLVECAVRVAYGNAASDVQLQDWVDDLALKKQACMQFLTSEQMKPLIDLGDCLVKATRELAANPEGIHYEVDKSLGTNKHVFSILGPHTENGFRPFTPSVQAQSNEAVKKFHNSKLHPSSNDWAKAAAADICAQVMESTGKHQVSLDDVKKEWLKRDSHFVFEAHLPSLIPLSFVDKIIIPKAKYMQGGALGTLADLQSANVGY
ncbi:hypothetical protein BC936DRAFT_145674 [Jimgerdemannia flammicorona]|uniref:Microbial-type PARG catalytic domain-containing protein n=1 Tax=Jimgerdemannia flammicorona TaxID=994334 RepID=A0A433D9D5_9FUNG|nr:hypothetical protein BC936DRAFT_145674 [Jimgerdemannia flammicorona]